MIHDRDIESFLAYVRKVFERLREVNVAVNPAKTKLGLSEVEYVGHVVAATGNSFTVDIVNGCAPDALLKNSFSILRVVSMARYLHLKTQEIHEALQKAHKVKLPQTGLASSSRTP